MTDDQGQTPCIRGCSKPVRDPETRETIGAAPIPATIGHLCARDANNLQVWLNDLVDLIAMLDTRMTTGDPYSPSRRGKISGSPSLIRLDAAAMLDPRSTATRRIQPGETPDPAQVRFGGDVPGVMCSWADWLCDDLAEKGDRPTTLTTAIAYLTTNWTALVYRPWIDEFHDELNEIRGQLRQVNNVRDPQPIGNCQCGRKLYLPDDGTGWVRCRTCGHQLDGRAVVMLGLAQTAQETG